MPSIFAYAKQAGFETVYIDAQRTGGDYQNGMDDGERRSIDRFVQFDDTPVIDRDMAAADALIEALGDNKRSFILINKMGAHFPVADKYLVDGQVYRPALPRNQSASVTEMQLPKNLYVGGESWRLYRNSYRNTLAWTVGGFFDRVLDGVVAFDMTIDEAGFRAITAEEGWTLPERLRLNFGPPPNPRAIDPAFAPLVRVFARSDRLPGAVNQAALRGRIVLRDGCFRLAEHGEGGEPLVLFDRDAELVRTAENYMVLRDGRTTTRIGEPVVWAGPRSANEADAGVKALRDRCGAGQIIPIGEPTSAANFPPRQ